MLLGWEHDPPFPPSEPGSSAFVSAAASLASTIDSLYDDNDHRGRRNSTGLDGTAPDQQSKGPDCCGASAVPGPPHATDPIGRHLHPASVTDRPIRTLLRKGRSTFGTSLGGSIAEEE